MGKHLSSGPQYQGRKPEVVMHAEAETDSLRLTDQQACVLQ